MTDPREMKVLVVEDDPDQQRLYEQLLAADAETNWVETYAVSANEAKALIEKDTFQVVVLDQNLKDESKGIELLEYLQERLASDRPAVVMLTNDVDVSVAVTAMRMGAVDFLTKPELANHSLPDVLVAAIARRDWQRSAHDAHVKLRRIAGEVNHAARLVTEELSQKRHHVRECMHQAMASLMADQQHHPAASDMNRAIGAMQDLEHAERQVIDLIERMRQAAESSNGRN